MKVAHGTLVALFVLGCNGGGATPDGSNDGLSAGDPAGWTCRQVGEALREKTRTVSKACVIDDDCTVVGYAENGGLPTCNCAPAFGHQCWGVGVNAQAWEADAEVAALLREWDGRCVPGGCAVADCACDCGYDPVTCRNGFCGNDVPNCFEQLVDASPDSSTPTDATVD